MAQSSDFYAVLGVDRNADEREIKKAYFRLVRKTPPETHPEEFRRLREAYEVLQNPESRKEHDDLTQYGDEIGGHLRAGMEAMDRGDLRFAQGEFARVLLLQPDLHMARDLLGMSYLNNGQPKEALSHFVALCDTAPDNATYQLHRGYAHYALDEYPEAVQCHTEARRLDPADTRPRVALADCYTAMDRFDDALFELTEAATRGGGPKELADFVLLLRKVQIQLLRDRVDLADSEIDAIARVLPEDAEVRKYVSQKLASLAAQLFRIKRSADGNRLLRRAQELGRTGAAAELVFPAWVSRPVAELPAASRTQLEDLARRPAPHKLVHGVWASPLLLLLLGVSVLFGGVYNTLSARHEWHGNTFSFMALLLLGGPILLYHAVLRIVRVRKSKLGRFTALHPLYLLQADLDQLTAWPLVNLHDVSMTHHLQNGVYQYTAVKADFAGVPLTLTIRGQQAAVDFAQALLDARHRCLGLLAVGMLEEEEGYDILPPEVLKGQSTAAAGPAQRRVQLGYAAAVLAGAALFAGGTAVNLRSAERASWEDTVAVPRAASLRRYLHTHPEGRHTAEAQASLQTIYDEAKARYERKSVAAPGRPALLAVLDALRTSPTGILPVHFQGHVDLRDVPGQSAPQGLAPLPPDRAFTEGQNRRRELTLTQSLGATLSRALPPDVLTLARTEVEGEGAAFEILYTVTPSGTVQPSLTDDGAIYGLRFHFVLRVLVPGLDPPFTVEHTSQPSQALRFQRPPYVHADEAQPYSRMAESAFEEFAAKVAVAFGAPRAPSLLPGRGETDGAASLRRMLLNLTGRRAAPAHHERGRRHELLGDDTRAAD